MAIRTQDFKQPITVMEVEEIIQHNNQTVFAVTQDGKLITFKDPEPREARTFLVYSNGTVEVNDSGLSSQGE